MTAGSVETFKLSRLTEELEKLLILFIKDYKDKNPHIKFLDNKCLSVRGRQTIPPDFNLPGYSFKIRDVSIKNPVVSAPLAGISDNTYRIFAGFFGAALTFTEMVTSYGIYYGHKKSLSLSSITDYERPCALQIFGSEPEIMAVAASKVEDRVDIIDINMGCPVPKILKARSGGYLLQDESRIEKIIKKLSSAINKPLTVKTRIGWDRDNINILNVAKIAEGSGADAISIHGRTVKQGFSGNVDYEIIKKVKEKVKIPVIAGGDIDSPKRAKQILSYTGCDAIMVGRAVKGRPWLLMNIFMYLCKYPEQKKEYAAAVSLEPDLGWKKEFSKLYLKFLVYFKGEDRGVREFRKHLSWIFKGSTGISKFKNEFFKIESFNGVINSIDRISAV